MKMRMMNFNRLKTTGIERDLHVCVCVHVHETLASASVPPIP